MAKKTINDVWRHLYPLKDRKVSEKSLKNLVTEKPKWKNLPTKAIRIPEVFADKLVEVAKIWDEGNPITNDASIEDKDMKQAISILKKSLKLPANKGGAIKQEIREAIRLLQAEDKN